MNVKRSKSQKSSCSGKKFWSEPCSVCTAVVGKVYFTYIQLELQYILVLMLVVFQWLEMLLFNVIGIESVNKIQ